jgi:UDP-glucose 4-epimerase
MTDFYANRHVLITGGLGFIGSNLAMELIERGATVTLLDSMIPSYGATVENIKPIRDRVTVNFSDVRDSHSLPYVVRDQEVIFCLAGQVSHIESMQRPLVDLDINCRSQLSLLECCRRVNPTVRLVFAGTRQIYGKPQFLPVTESHPLDPTDVNGVNKLAAEMYYMLYAKIHGMSTICLRLTNTFGPRMDLVNRKKGFVGVFIQQALRGEPIRLFGDGQQRRDFNYISDVTQALAMAATCLHSRGESFNIGHHEHYSLIEFLEALQKHCPLDYQCVPFPDEIKVIDIGDFYADYTKFEKLTGWRPQVDLDTGLRLTLDYYRQARQSADP